MGDVKKAIKKVTGGSILNALFDPGRHFFNTKEDEAAKQAAEQANRERQMFEQQQRQLQEANTLAANNVTTGIAKVETGAGTDVSTDMGFGPTKKKKATASSTLGVM